MSDTQASAPADEVECNCPDLLFCKRNGGCTKLDSAPAAPADDLDALVARLGSSSVVIGNLPELPGYNGSILQIDDTEAARIAKEIDEAAQAVIDLRAQLQMLATDKAAVRVNLLRGTLARPDDLIFMHDTNGPYAKQAARITRLEAENKEARELLKTWMDSNITGSQMDAWSKTRAFFAKGAAP